MPIIDMPKSPTSRFFFSNKKTVLIWAILRIYVGYQWFEAGWTKVFNPAWTGDSVGAAVSGFLQGALTKATGTHPAVSGWYAEFIQMVALPHAQLFSYLVAYGELAVGIALIVGLLTGIAAFFGAFMNLNYLLAGTISTNPLLLLIQLFLILAWRVAGWYGLDRYILPALGIPWRREKEYK